MVDGGFTMVISHVVFIPIFHFIQKSSEKRCKIPFEIRYETNYCDTTFIVTIFAHTCKGWRDVTWGYH